MKFERLMELLAGVLALIVLIGGAVVVVAPFGTAPLGRGAAVRGHLDTRRKSS